MSLLNDGVLSSVTLKGRGDFRFTDISNAHEELLKSITKRQRAKYVRYGLIPQQLLVILWDNGYLPGDSSPRTGMKIGALLDILRDSRYSHGRRLQQGQWLYEKLVKEELMGTSPRPKAFLKGNLA